MLRSARLGTGASVGGCVGVGVLGVWCGQSGVCIYLFILLVSFFFSSPGRNEKIDLRRCTSASHNIIRCPQGFRGSYSSFTLYPSAVLGNIVYVISKSKKFSRFTKSLLRRIPSDGGAPSGCTNSNPRSAGNRRVTCNTRVLSGAAVIWGWDKREERLWKWKHRFSLLLHSQWSSGGASSLQDSLILESQNTCCLPDRWWGGETLGVTASRSEAQISEGTRSDWVRR